MSRQKPVWSPDTPPHFATSKSQQQPVIVWCKVHRSRNFSPTQGGISEGPSFPCPTTSLPSVRGSYGRRKAISEGSRLDFERCQRQHMTKCVDFQKGLAKPLWDFRTELNIIGYFCRLCFSCCLCFLKCIAPGQLFFVSEQSVYIAIDMKSIAWKALDAIIIFSSSWRFGPFRSRALGGIRAAKQKGVMCPSRKHW